MYAKGYVVEKKPIQIIKYITLSVAICLFIITISILSVWILLQIKGSLSFKPTNNISITLSGLSLFPTISFQSIQINLKDYNTDVKLNNIQIKFPLLKPKNVHVYIQECNIDTNTALQSSPPLPTQHKVTYKKEPIDLQSLYIYLPQQMFIENIFISITDNENKWSLSGIPLKLDKAQNHISLSSSHTPMEILYKGKKETLIGKIDISHHFTQQSQEVKTNIQFPPYLLVSGNLNIDNSLQKLNAENINITLDENISNSFSSLFYSIFAIPISWQKLQVDNLNSSLTYRDTQWIPENISGKLSIYTLTIGDKEKPWLSYSSDITIRSHYSAPEQTTEVILNTEKDPGWEIKWRYNHVNQTTYLDFSSNILQGTLIKNLSPHFYDTLLLQKIEPFSIECTLSLQGTIPFLEGKVKGKISLPYINNIQLDSKLDISPNNEGSSQLKWSGEWNCFSTPILFSTEFIPSSHWTAHIQTKKLPAKIIQPFTPSILKNALDNASTDVEINITANKSYNIDLQFNGQLSPKEETKEYPPIVPSEFHFQGAIQNWNDIIGNFRLSSENSTDFELNPCKLHLFPLSLEGNTKTKIYLSTIASEFLPYYMPGKTNFNGKLYWNGSGKIQIQGSGSAEGLGIGGYILPEGVPLCFDTNITTDFYNYSFDIDYLKIGFVNCNLGVIQKSTLLLPLDNRHLSLTSQNIEINGSLTDLQNWGISEESTGTFSLKIKDFEYKENQINNGEMEWNINIPDVILPSWQIQIKNFNSQSQFHSLTSPDFPLNITMHEIILKNIRATQIESNLKLKLQQLGVELEQIKGNLWSGIITTKGSIQKKESSIMGNFTGQYNHLDLAQFTTEVQPPWLKLTGLANGNFDINVDFSTGQLVDGDFSLACPEGLTINRDVLLQLILYLQNVSIVQKQLEKLLGKEDPKPFTNGELTLGFKNNQATVSLLLTTPNINLAPIFYINADWKTLWSLITTPSGVQIEIK